MKFHQAIKKLEEEVEARFENVELHEFNNKTELLANIIEDFCSSLHNETLEQLSKSYTEELVENYIQTNDFYRG